jgi:L-alanine-DL-glutamate epimerase-like enolase superfamily enzyme
LKITKVETIPVSLPVGFFKDGMCKVRGVNAPSKYHASKVLDKSLKISDPMILHDVIVKIHTDEGVTGVGATACESEEPWESPKILIDRYLAPRIIGVNPLNRELILGSLPQSWPSSLGTSGIDLALHDLIGKALKIPVSSLIGGCQQEKILLCTEVPRGTPEKMAEHSLEYYEQGVRGFKAKVGSDPDRDAKSLKAMRDALGDKVSLRADANRGYTVKEAIRMCKLAEKYEVDLEVLEQPCDKWDLDGTAEVRRSVDTPIEVDESVHDIFDVGLVIKKDAADVINTKLNKVGGIYNVKKCAAIAESGGLETVIGTEWGIGPQVAAKLHLGASTRNVNPVIEFTEIMIHDMLLPFNILDTLKDGYLDIPTKPGLGLELDEDKIEEFRTPDTP